MKRPQIMVQNEVRRGAPEEWIERLGVLLKTIEAMDPEERTASLAYAKSRFRSDWPGDTY